MPDGSKEPRTAFRLGGVLRRAWLQDSAIFSLTQSKDESNGKKETTDKNLRKMV
jgi:hypothetical protein